MAELTPYQLDACLPVETAKADTQSFAAFAASVNAAEGQ